MSNLVIAVAIGAVVGVAGTIAGVTAYQDDPGGVQKVQLYKYADN